MKYLLQGLLLLVAMHCFGQSASYSEHENTRNRIMAEQEAAHASAEGRWFENSPDPRAVMLACDGHYPRYYCRRHHKQCSSFCNCGSEYRNELDRLDKDFEARLAACDAAYNRAVEEKAAADRAAADRARVEADRAEAKRAAAASAEAEAKKADADKAAAAQKGSGGSSKKGSSTNGKSSSSSNKKSATSYYAVESEHDRQMRQRATAQRASTDQATKTATAAAGAVAVTGAAFAAREIDNEDDDDDLSTYLKLTLGLGLQEIPVTQNMTYNAASGSSQRTQKSSSTTTNHCDARLGVLFAVLNDRFVSFRVSPFVSYGINAFNSTTTGSHLSYGSGGAVGVGRRLKVLVQGEYAARSGNLFIDNATYGIDAAGTADYKYSTLKYGLGAYYGLGGANMFVQASAFHEKVSFLKGVDASVFSYEVKLSVGILGLAVQYSPNYPIAGKLDNPNGYGRDKQTYLSANLYVPLTLISD